MAGAQGCELLCKLEKEEERKRPVTTGRGAGIGVALFPSPFEGHLRPMFDLADILHSQGFSITIIHTHYNSPNPKEHPTSFSFVPIADGLPENLTSGEDYMSFIIALNTNCSAPFHSALESLVQSSSPPVACLIVDAQLYFTRQVAEQCNLQRIVLRTSSAASFRAFAAFPELGNDYLQVQEHLREEPVPGMPPLRFKDLPVFRRSQLTSVNTVLTFILKETRAAALVVMNTSDALERIHLEKLRIDLDSKVLAIGPLHKLSPPLINSKVASKKSDNTCMDWLNEQPPRSVIYVSFGSLACINKEELVEIAWGLANSRQRFLWVIRTGLIRDIEIPSSALLKEFEDEVRDRGRIIHWAPQQEVLQHNALGGFWTHCGWNSILESIYEGVPMICYPYFGDQYVNARFVTSVWKVGIAMDCNLERDIIKEVVQRLMVAKEGKEILERARLLKNDVCSSLQRGVLHGSIDSLLDHIVEITSTKLYR